MDEEEMVVATQRELLNNETKAFGVSHVFHFCAVQVIQIRIFINLNFKREKWEICRRDIPIGVS